MFLQGAYNGVLAACDHGLQKFQEWCTINLNITVDALFAKIADSSSPQCISEGLNFRMQT